MTLIEKLDGLHRRFPNERIEPATFVRHYEDAAHVISAAARLPPLSDYGDVHALASDMLAKKQIAAFPRAEDPAFMPTDSSRWDIVRRAHGAIGQMFWGPRLALEDACRVIRDWISVALA